MQAYNLYFFGHNLEINILSNTLAVIQEQGAKTYIQFHCVTLYILI